MRKIEGGENRELLNEILIRPFRVQKASVRTGLVPEIQLSRKKDLCDFLAMGIYCLTKSIWNPEDEDVIVQFSNEGFGTASSNIKMMMNDGTCYPIPHNALGVQCAENCQRVIRYMAGKDSDPSMRIISVILYPNFTAYAAGYFGEYPRYDDMVPRRFNCMDSMQAQVFAYKLLTDECGRYRVI